MHEIKDLKKENKTVRLEVTEMEKLEKEKILLIDDWAFKVENTQELDCNKCNEFTHLQSKCDELYAEYLTSNNAFNDKQNNKIAFFDESPPKRH